MFEKSIIQDNPKGIKKDVLNDEYRTRNNEL
jgi:hypothetical protein